MLNYSLITSKHFIKVFACLIINFLIVNFAKAQTNLIPNPSFEQYTNCPDNSTSIAGRNSKPDIWYKPDARGGGT